MQGYLRERGDINIKRPHSNRRKIADKVFIVQPGGRLVHCQITRSPLYTEIQRDWNYHQDLNGEYHF